MHWRRKNLTTSLCCHNHTKMFQHARFYHILRGLSPTWIPPHPSSACYQCLTTSNTPFSLSAANSLRNSTLCLSSYGWLFPLLLHLLPPRITTLLVQCWYPCTYLLPSSLTPRPFPCAVSTLTVPNTETYLYSTTPSLYNEARPCA